VAEKGSTEAFLHSGNMHGMVVGAVGFVFTALLQGNGYIPMNPLVTVLGVVVSFYTGKLIARTVLNSSARMASGIYNPDGASTAYTPSFSHIEALEIRGDLDGAAEAWELAVHEQPDSALTLVRAADFHLRARKDPQAAVELYLRARTLGTGNNDLRRYVQQKLVDLHLGPLADEGRALVELRRLIDGFPGTREAEGARAALAELKSRRAPGERA
jgi:hypothetical protein